jgi:uncharacterized protein (TIGR00251 family)
MSATGNPQEPMLQTTADGVIVDVKAQPGARRAGIVGMQGGRLKVAVTAVAERGRANEALVETLAVGLALRKSQVELVSGETNPLKRFLLRGITEAELRERLARFNGS